MTVIVNVREVLDDYFGLIDISGADKARDAVCAWLRDEVNVFEPVPGVFISFDDGAVESVVEYVRGLLLVRWKDGYYECLPGDEWCAMNCCGHLFARQNAEYVVMPS